MKKLFFSLAAIVALFAVSCTTDMTSDVQVADEGIVTLTLKAPGADSRVTLDQSEETTIGNGKKATELRYAVYDKDWNCLKVEVTDFPQNSLEKTLELRLVKNKTYNFVFWAQAPFKADGTTQNDFYTVNLGSVGDAAVAPTVEVNYNSLDANDDYRDAFFGQRTNLTVNGTVNETVVLTRPFAQVNFGTTEADVNAALEMGLDLTAATTSFTAEGYETLDLVTGAVSDKVSVTFNAAELPENKTLKAKTAAGTEYYYWAAMNYILWSANATNQYEALATCSMTVKSAGNQDVTISYPGAPANRNYRTNLVGSLLTEQANIKVIINPIFATEEYTSEDAFASQLTSGGSVTLNGNITLNNNAGGFTINDDTEIDLKGYTLTIPDTEASRASSSKAAMFTVEGDANLTIKNGKIVIESTNGEVSGTGTSTGAGNVVVFNSTGNLKIDDVTVEGSKRGGWRAVEVMSGSAVISNSTFNCYYGSAVNSSNADVALNDCDITVTGMYSAPYNSVCFSVMNGGKLTVNGGNYKMINNNTYATGDSHGGWLGIVMNSGGTLILNDGNFENVPAAGFNPAYERAIIEAENLDPATAKVVFAGGKYKPQYNKVVSGYGDKEYPVLVGADKLADTDGDGWYILEDNKGYVVDGDEYLVSTGAGFAAAVVDAPATANISLTADVDLTGIEYTPRSFSKLVFEGNNHTISGVKVENALQAALFGKTWNFDIKNVTLANSTFVGQNIDGEDAAAGFIGFFQAIGGNGKFTNCHIENCTFGSAKFVGGIIAYKNGTPSLEITDCSVKNSTFISKYTENNGVLYKGHCGGVVGLIDATQITNCVVEGNTFDTLGKRCGLFIGSAQVDSPVSGSVSGNTGLAQLCGSDVNNITDWSNVSVTLNVTTAEELAQCVNNATADVVVALANDIEATSTVLLKQKEGVNVTILGNDNDFKGLLSIRGYKQLGTSTLTIKDIHFTAASATSDACIVGEDRGSTGVYAYSHCVTVDNCTFSCPISDDPKCAAVRHKDGGDSNWTLIDCTVDNTLHSLIQTNNILGNLKVERCKVYSKNGANLNSTCKAEFIDCEFDVRGLAVRVGVNSGGNPDEPKTFTFTGGTLKSACEDGDAVIIIRTSAQNATLNFNGTVLEGTTKISGNVEGKTQINGAY